MTTLQDIQKFREETARAEEPSPEPSDEARGRRVVTEVSANAPLGEEGEEPIDDEDGAGGEPPSDDTADDEVAYFNELPETMGWDPEQFYNLKLKTDSGDEYTWSEIKDTLQKTKTTEAELSSRQKALEEQENRFRQQVQHSQDAGAPISAEMQEAQGTLQVVEQAYYAGLQNLENYKQEGNTEGMVVAQAELTRLQTIHAQARERFNAAAQKQQGFLAQQNQQFLADQHRKLVATHPEFGDEAKRSELIPKMTDFLRREGLTNDEIDRVADARVSSLLYKAYLWDQHNQKVKNVLNDTNGKGIKRIVKGQRPHSPSVAQREERKQAVNTARSSGRESDRRLARRAIAKEAGLLG